MSLTTSSAIATLTDPLDGRWISRFIRAGREYTVASSGGWAFGSDARGEFARVPVLTTAGERTLKIRDRETIRPVSYMGNWDYKEVLV